MAKRFWLTLLKTTVAACIVAGVFGVAFHYLTDDGPHNYIFAAGSGIAIYLAAGLFVAIINALAQWLYLAAMMRDDFKMDVLEALRNSKVPAPAHYHRKRIAYLSEVADDDSYTMEERVRCATLFGMFEGMKMHLPLFRKLAWEKAADSAVLRYAMEAPTAKNP